MCFRKWHIFPMEEARLVAAWIASLSPNLNHFLSFQDFVSVWEIVRWWQVQIYLEPHFILQQLFKIGKGERGWQINPNELTKLTQLPLSSTNICNRMPTNQPTNQPTLALAQPWHLQHRPYRSSRSYLKKHMTSYCPCHPQQHQRRGWVVTY